MEKSTNDKKKLGLFALVAIAAGQVIGAGVITTTGLAIAETGKSTWIAYLIAILAGALWTLPTVFFSSIAKYKGGAYTLVTACLGPLAGGIYALWWLMMWLTLGLMGLSLGSYVNSVFPSLPKNITGLVAITIFFVINLRGINAMAKFQKIMTTLLFVGLGTFIILGLFNLLPGSLDLSSADYFLNGKAGVLAAVMLLVYSTSGQALVSGFSWDAKRPKRDISLAILITTGILIVLYCGIALVAANVLPVSEVAGKPLTYVSKAIFPGNTYLLFIFGGPILALATTLNSGYATMTAPALGAIRNGWLPESMGKRNKYGAPWVCYTIRYCIGAIPIIIGVSMSSLTNYTVMVQRLNGTLMCIAALMIPIKFKDAWKKSFLHIPDWLYYIIMGFSLITQIGAVGYSLSTMRGPVFWLNVAVALALAGYAVFRYKTGKTHSHITYTLDDEVEELAD